jgi:hypothetical protein
MSCTAPKCRDLFDLLVSVSRLRGLAVLADHAAEHPPAQYRRSQGHDDRLVVIRWPLLPGLMRPVPVVTAPRGAALYRPHRAMDLRPPDGDTPVADLATARIGVTRSSAG